MMRHVLGSFVLFLAAAGSVGAADEAAPTVHLYRSGERALTVETKAALAEWGVKVLKSANFNTADHADILQQSVVQIQDRYRQTVRGGHVVISWNDPVTIETAGGRVTAVEVVVGLGRPDSFASALFSIDPTGRIVAHEKYVGLLPVSLQPGAVAGRAR